MTDSNRRQYAQNWRETRQAIVLLHKAGHYGAAAVLRNYLNLTFRCWLASKNGVA